MNPHHLKEKVIMVKSDEDYEKLFQGSKKCSILCRAVLRSCHEAGLPS